MSLYHVQKFLYQLNRDTGVQAAYREDRTRSTAGYDLEPDERQALVEADIGLLYHMGVNGQILMHFAAFCGIEWSDYLQRMRDGVEQHGPVRAGVYALAGYEGVDAHSRSLGHKTDKEQHTARRRSLGHKTDKEQHTARRRSTDKDPGFSHPTGSTDKDPG